MHTIFSALGEETRLRIYVLCKEAELNLTDLCQVLGQSQPRVSRHLRILRQAGLIEKHAVGQNMFFRALRREPLALDLLKLVERHSDRHAQLQDDVQRMQAMLDIRATFSDSLERDISKADGAADFLYSTDDSAFALLDSLARQTGTIERWLDVGCGSGGLLEALAEHCVEAVGVDISKERIAVARTRLTRAGHKHCSVQLGDMYGVPAPDESFDFVTLHRVLIHADAPRDALVEAARLLSPHGTLAVIDYASHSHKDFGERFGHRWPGFEKADLVSWATQAGLRLIEETGLIGEGVTSHVLVFHKAANADGIEQQDERARGHA